MSERRAIVSLGSCRSRIEGWLNNKRVARVDLCIASISGILISLPMSVKATAHEGWLLCED